MVVCRRAVSVAGARSPRYVSRPPPRGGGRAKPPKLLFPFPVSSSLLLLACPIMRRNINWKSSSLSGQAVALSDIFRIVARLARVALRRQPTLGSSSVSPVRQILDLSSVSSSVDVVRLTVTSYFRFRLTGRLDVSRFLSLPVSRLAPLTLILIWHRVGKETTFTLGKSSV